MTYVLVLTNSYDDSHVEAVFNIIRAQGHQTLRVDIDRIAKGEHHISLDYATGEILFITPDGTFDLNEVDSIWYRKPFGFSQTFGFMEHIQDPMQRTIVDKEMHDIVDSICVLLADKFWQPPSRNCSSAPEAVSDLCGTTRRTPNSTDADHK